MDQNKVIDHVEETNVIKVYYQKSLPSDFLQLIQAIIVDKISKYGSFVIHLDLKGLNITTLMKNIPWIENIMNHFDTNSYDAYLTNVFIYNAGFIAKQIYSLIGRFLRNIKEKIVFVPKERPVSSSSSFLRYTREAER
jgi:hypothetical protein